MSALLFLVLGAILLSFSGSAFGQDSLPDTVAAVKPSVVLIVTYNSAGKPLAAGSGFCIAAGRIVTNNHVISGAARITVRLGTGSVNAVKNVLVADKDLDLAILETGLNISQIVPLQLTSVLPREGERLFVVSNPEGLSGSVSDGIVSAIRRFQDGSILVQITAPISHGSSGGPVLNMKGQVIGVAVGSFKGGQNLNFMIPAAAVARLTKRMSAPVGAVPIVERKNLPTAVTARIEPMPIFPKPEIREHSLAEAKRLYSEGIRVGEFKSTGREQNAAKLQAAMSFFEAAIQVDSNLADAWRELGQTAWRLGRLRDDKVLQGKATAALRKAIELAPDQYEAYALLAQRLSINGDLPSALGVCDPLVKAGKAAGFLCQGRAFEGIGNPEQAIESYRRGVQTYPTEESLLNALTFTLESKGRYKESAVYWESLIKLKPGDLEVKRSYAQTLSISDRRDEAIEVYRQIVGRKESQFADYRDLVTQLYIADRHDEAVSVAKDMVRNFPNDPQAWDELGSSYGFTGQRAEQIAAFKKAVELAPDRAAGHSTLGFGYSQSERYEEAVQAFLEAIRLEPMASTYSSLGKSYAKLGRYGEALDSFGQAVVLSPDDPEIQESLGEFYSQLGYYQKAVEAYARALRLSTGFRYEGSKPRLHYLLGKCYLDLGNRAAALAEYKTLKSLDAQYSQLLFDSIYK
ncbi:MAG TPA: tetratricopeptide repeat protein [Pyrinomonadaceae bacterium]|nr:tetratricopeptide repeat protein [Pyrinomonadaceae bacterium]